jgi:hypothetical protein
MTDTTPASWPADSAERLGKQMKRGGWIGVFIQLLLLIVPILIAIYVRMPWAGDPEGGAINIGNYLSYGGLLVMLFTTFWFFRYTMIGSRL